MNGPFDVDWDDVETLTEGVTEAAVVSQVAEALALWDGGSALTAYQAGVFCALTYLTPKQKQKLRARLAKRRAQGPAAA